jgi:hypothetical protein
LNRVGDSSIKRRISYSNGGLRENAASVVFLEMKRVGGKGALGNSFDAICGHVRGKLAGDTGDKPFLYVVQKDKAYIGAYNIATTEYRNICN